MPAVKMFCHAFEACHISQYYVEPGVAFCGLASSGSFSILRQVLQLLNHACAVQAFEPKRGEHMVTKAKSPQLATRSRARPEVSVKPIRQSPP